LCHLQELEQLIKLLPALGAQDALFHELLEFLEVAQIVQAKLPLVTCAEVVICLHRLKFGVVGIVD
jgi:hypothetical protein